MMRKELLTGISMLLLAGLLQAQDKKIMRSDLPKVVADTVDRETKGSTIKAFLTSKEDGQKVYEVETVIDGHTRDIQIAEDGTLNEIEEQVSIDSLASDVKKAIIARAEGAEIKKVESLTKKGKLVAYEAATLKGAKKGEVQVGPRGETLTHEE